MPRTAQVSTRGATTPANAALQPARRHQEPVAGAADPLTPVDTSLEDDLDQSAKQAQGARTARPGPRAKRGLSTCPAPEDSLDTASVSKEVGQILKKCQDYKGHSHTELSESLEKAKIDFGVEELKSKFI